MMVYGTCHPHSGASEPNGNLVLALSKCMVRITPIMLVGSVLASAVLGKTTCTTTSRSATEVNVIIKRGRTIAKINVLSLDYGQTLSLCPQSHLDGQAYLHLHFGHFKRTQGDICKDLGASGGRTP